VPVLTRALTAFVLLATLGAAATAQDWPARPVTMVIPTAAGGGADILGRVLGARLAELLGQPVIIELVRLLHA
jgi:tripartite-type tricarboxylate transporter receptor subunit TctC